MISIGRLNRLFLSRRRLTTRGFTSRLQGIGDESKGLVGVGEESNGLVEGENKKEVGKVVYGYVDASWSQRYKSYFLGSVFMRETDQGTTKPFAAQVIRRAGSEYVPPYKNIYSDDIHGSHDAELASGVLGSKFILNNLSESDEKLILTLDNKGAYSHLIGAAERVAEGTGICNPPKSWTDRMLNEFQSAVVSGGIPVSIELVTNMRGGTWMAHRCANFRFSGDQMRFEHSDLLKMENLQMFRSEMNKNFLVYFENDGKIGVIVDSIKSADISETVIKSHGGVPGKFEIIPASPDPNQLAVALQKLGSDAEHKTIIINLNGGGTAESSKALANCIVHAVFLARPDVPVFVNFFGKGLKEAKLVLKKSGMDASMNLDDAVLKSLDAMRAAGK